MKLIFKQKISLWTGRYDIYDEVGNTVFVVEGEILDLWPSLTIYDAQERKLGAIQRDLSFITNKFELYKGEERIGLIRGKLSLFGHVFEVDYNGWRVEGDMMGWDYQILDKQENCVAEITKDILKLRDVYAIDVKDPEDALGVLMVVLAIDLDKASR